MWFKKQKNDVLTPEVYENIYRDVQIWCITELNAIPPQIVNGQQVNALLNFATFDLHALVTQVGFLHMQKLLLAKETEQTVMIRLKDLVADLYIKYGDGIIDAMRRRVYSTIEDVYGLTYDNLEEQLDLNNTLWLHPFVRRMYTELQVQK